MPLRPSNERTPLLQGKNSTASAANLDEDEERTKVAAISNASADDSEEDGESPPISTRQYMILSVLMVATLTSSFAVCLFPPFFPKIAEEKGCNAGVYGFIIGTNCLTSFIVTPYIGKKLRTVGVRFALIVGMFTGGVCCMLSGFLEFFSPGWKFVALSVLIRIVHATGNAMVITATFTFTAIEFQNSVGKVFSLTRTAMNLAQLCGPSIGGLIYEFGGFYMPFVVMGCVQIVMSIISIYLLPECRTPPSPPKNGREKKVTILNMLRIPRIWISFFTFIAATACNGFLSINLEPQVLRNFELSPFYVGLLFGLKDGANSVASPIWGILCDKSRKSSVKPYIIGSAFFVGASFFLLGADNLIGINLSLTIPLVVTALCLNGIGIGGEQVAGIVDALHEAVNAGYPNDPNMHGLVAGLWSSLSGAGRFVSRAGSGFLVVHIGFNKTAAIATSLQMLVGLITLFYMFAYECKLKNHKSVRWDDVTVIEDSEGSHDNVEVVFTETQSPSESLMSRSVHVDIPSSKKRSASKGSVTGSSSAKKDLRKRSTADQTPDVTESYIRSSSID